MGWARVSVLIDMEIELVVFFGVVETLQRFNVCDNLGVLVPFPLEDVFHTLGNVLLFRCSVVDAAPVLCADIVSLGVECGWVVNTEEELRQLFVGDSGRLVGDKDSLCKVGCPRADGFVGWRMNVFFAVGIPNLDVHNLIWDIEVFPEDVFHPPEAACSKGRQL